MESWVFAPVTIHRRSPRCARAASHTRTTSPVFGGGDVDVALAMVSADPTGPEAPSLRLHVLQ